RNPRPRGVGRHVAVEPDPVDGAVGALLLPVGTFVERGGEAGELELELVDGLPNADHLIGDIKLLRNQLDHAKIVPNIRTMSSKFTCRKVHPNLTKPHPTATRRTHHNLFTAHPWTIPARHPVMT